MTTEGASLFRPESILEPNAVPELFCHGPRNITLLPGNVVCYWMCQDEALCRPTEMPLSRLVARLYIPLQSLVWGRQAAGLWLRTKGLDQIEPLPPSFAITRPDTTLIM
jgi:hypothetical protein